MRGACFWFVRLSVVVSVLTLLTASPALSQSTGLFGATRPDATDGLNLLFNLSEGYETELPPEFRQRVRQNELTSGGFSTLFVASADYSRRRRRLQLGATGSTAFRHYHRLGRFAAVSHTAGLGANVLLPKQGTLQINQSIAYAPSYLYGLFPTEALLIPGEAIQADPNYRIDESGSYSYGTNVSVGFGSASGTRFSVTGDYNYTDFRRETLARSDTSFYGLGGRVSRAVSRSTTLYGDYQYRTADFRSGDAGDLTREHSGAFGLEYSRALSRSRRATLRVNVSPSRLDIPESSLAVIAAREEIPVSDLDATLYRFQTEVSAEYPFRLNWMFNGNFRRGVEYLAVLSEPIFADGARLGVTGLITRRIDISGAFGYATGASAVYGEGQDLRTYTGNARLRFGLTRSIAAYSEYLYYNYDMRGQFQLAPDLPSAFEQHAIRVGVMLFASLGR